MDDITGFVDAIYTSYDKFINAKEEDQQLPPKEILNEVCQVLLNVSCMREEGRFPSFRVCFAGPDSELLDSYIYAHTILFDTPIHFGSRELNKLAPALNPDISYLMLDIRERPFKMIGIIVAYTAFEKLLTRELVSGNRMPGIPNILVKGPGELSACFAESSIVNYYSGHCVYFRTNTFTSTFIADQLRDGSNVSENDRLQLLYRILWQISNYEHGAAVLLVPSAESCAKYIDVKYRMNCPFLFGDDHGHSKVTGKAREKDIVTYADFIAKLTSVDGSVVLTKNFDLLGFGAETLVDEMERKQPPISFIDYNDKEDTNKHFKDFGMRHRAGYRFCNAVKGSVAFIISQDGIIEGCTMHDGKVIVYDNIALPLF